MTAAGAAAEALTVGAAVEAVAAAAVETAAALEDEDIKVDAGSAGGERGARFLELAPIEKNSSGDMC